MSDRMNDLLKKYIDEVHKIYGCHLKTVILYGSYARGDYRADSDIDIMILVDIDDNEIKKYRHDLSYKTYDLNMENDAEINPITKSVEHFNKWSKNYPFYTNVLKEGVILYGAA